MTFELMKISWALVWLTVPKYAHAVKPAYYIVSCATSLNQKESFWLRGVARQTTYYNYIHVHVFDIHNGITTEVWLRSMAIKKSMICSIYGPYMAHVKLRTRDSSLYKILTPCTCTQLSLAKTPSWHCIGVGTRRAPGARAPPNQQARGAVPLQSEPCLLIHAVLGWNIIKFRE